MRLPIKLGVLHLDIRCSWSGIVVVSQSRSGRLLPRAQQVFEQYNGCMLAAVRFIGDSLTGTLQVWKTTQSVNVYTYSDKTECLQVWMTKTEVIREEEKLPWCTQGIQIRSHMFVVLSMLDSMPVQHL